MLDARSIYKWAKLKTVFATSILSKKICDVWGRIYVESLCFRLCRRDASLKNRFKEDSRFSRLLITLCKYIILRSLLRVKTRMYRNRYGYIPEEINVFFVHMAPFVVTWSHLGRKVRFVSCTVANVDKFDIFQSNNRLTGRSTIFYGFCVRHINNELYPSL